MYINQVDYLNVKQKVFNEIFSRETLNIITLQGGVCAEFYHILRWLSGIRLVFNLFFYLFIDFFI